MVYLYLAAIFAARIAQAIFSKRSSNEVKGIAMTAKYTAYHYTISACLGLILVLLADGFSDFSIANIGISVLSGVALFLSSFCSIYGMKSGTVSLVSMFGTAGLIVPVIAGVFVFNQPVSIMQCVGVAVFFVSAWFLIKNSKNTYSVFGVKTAILLIGTLLANGLTMLAQQMYTFYIPDGSISLFSFVSFATAAVLGMILSLAISKKDTASAANSKMPKILYISGGVLAAAVFVINQFATTLTSMLSPVILFTLINGGATIISTLVAAILYREKLTQNSVVGVILGVLSLATIKAFDPTANSK